jgi:hypothetical protein
MTSKGILERQRKKTFTKGALRTFALFALLGTHDYLRPEARKGRTCTENHKWRSRGPERAEMTFDGFE